jgi:hypothetical protein
LENIGNGLEISIKVKIQKLSLEENCNKFETLLKEHNMKAKKLEKGIYLLSNRKKFGTEIETAKEMQKSIKEIVNAEKCLYLE